LVHNLAARAVVVLHELRESPARVSALSRGPEDHPGRMIRAERELKVWRTKRLIAEVMLLIVGKVAEAKLVGEPNPVWTQTERDSLVSTIRSRSGRRDPMLMVDTAITRAPRFVETHWHEISLVGRTLLSCGKVSGRQLQYLADVANQKADTVQNPPETVTSATG
jgi:hypothetical protein